MVFSPHHGSRTRPRDHRSVGIRLLRRCFISKRGTQAEITMNRQSDRDRIAEEAVGQRHGSAPPYAEGKAGVSQEEAARQLAPSSGAQASTPEKPPRPSVSESGMRIRTLKGSSNIRRATRVG